MHNPQNKTLLNNAYDNSVAFTDAWLFGLIQQLKQQQAISSLLLVSDHGENIFDGNCHKSGHGHHTEFDYRVAALWWGSEKFSSGLSGASSVIATTAASATDDQSNL